MPDMLNRRDSAVMLPGKMSSPGENGNTHSVALEEPSDVIAPDPEPMPGMARLTQWEMTGGTADPAADTVTDMEPALVEPERVMLAPPTRLSLPVTNPVSPEVLPIVEKPAESPAPPAAATEAVMVEPFNPKDTPLELENTMAERLLLVVPPLTLMLVSDVAMLA